jgi:hypothetical protein
MQIKLWTNFIREIMDNIRKCKMVRMQSIGGNTAAFVMQTMSNSINKLSIFFLLFLVTTAAFADGGVINEVAISAGRHVDFRYGKLFIIDKSSDRPIRAPAELASALKNSLEIIFPESDSRLLGGKDVILLVTKVPSSKVPNGYCGAGTEDTLHALEIDGDHASSIFSIIVGSCLKNIELISNGVDPPFKSIRWIGDPPRISVSWSSDRSGLQRTHTYAFVQRKFLEVNVGKQ